MEQTILSKNQKKLLVAIANSKMVTDNFVLSGGTALAEYYLHHRLSEDLDFFSETEIDAQAIFIFLKSIQKKIHFQSVEYIQSFNRNLFFIKFRGDEIKTEFTYYPFPAIETLRKQHGLRIDSLRDIAVNKLFTIYQKPRSRDFIDLFFIIQQKNWSIETLKKQAQIKFETHLDPLQLGSQFCQCKTLKDYPRMLVDIEHTTWHRFFLDQAKKLKTNILK
ncbi:MAG: hypothetical protein A2233_03105 [Candidatus Kerfeldbacteria bacterium RIFOXYA2_FULL_38_24]|nr:MAG: hypothetical protein A2233_03105 [Candidatus Kerfeldbacteria bacterium RIFOXYA2_FULL_38_24]